MKTITKRIVKIKCIEKLVFIKDDDIMVSIYNFNNEINILNNIVGIRYTNLDNSKYITMRKRTILNYLNRGYTIKILRSYNGKPYKCIETLKYKTVSNELEKYLIENNFTSIIEVLKKSKDSKNYFDFSVSDPSKISYLKGDRIPQDKTLIFDKEYRKNNAYHSKVGKILSNSVDNTTIQKLSSLFYNRVNRDDKLFVTDKIKYYYHVNNYANKDNGSGGDLHQSCMRHNCNQDSIGFYELLSKDDKVKLLVLTNDDNEVLARALLWNRVEYKDKYITYMDRVFAINNNIADKLYQYAESKGYNHYKDSNYGTMKVKYYIDYDIALPYLDTFKGYENGYLYNDSDRQYVLENVDGYNLNELDNNMCTCESCDNTFDSDNEGGYTHNGEILCDNCGIYINAGSYEGYYHRENTVEVNGEYYHKDDTDTICYSEYENEYLLLDDVRFSEYENDYIHVENCVFCEHEDDYFLTSDCIKIDNEWYFKESDTVTQLDNGEYIINETV